MVAAVRIPTAIKDPTAARAAFNSMSPDEADRFWKMVDGGVDKMHAINLIRSQRAQSAASGADIDGAGQNAAGEATPVNSALVEAGNAATGGGVPTLVAAYNAARGRGSFADEKQQAKGDLQEIEAQNPIAAGGVGQAIGLLAPAAGGLVSGAARGTTAAALGGGRSTLMQLAGSGAKMGGALGAMQGALQTDTGTLGDVAENAIGGAAKGAAMGAGGSVAGGALLKLMPSLGTTGVGAAARAPLSTAKNLGGELLDNSEDALVSAPSDLARAVARIAPGAGKVAGAVKGFNVAGPLGIMKGAEIGGAAGQKAANVLNDFAFAPYEGASMEIPASTSPVPDITRTMVNQASKTIVDPNVATRVQTPTPTPTTPAGADAGMDLTPGRVIQFERAFTPQQLREQLTALGSARDVATNPGGRANPLYNPMSAGAPSSPTPRAGVAPVTASEAKADMPLDAMIGENKRPIADVANDLYGADPQEAAREMAIDEAIGKTRGARARAPSTNMNPDLVDNVIDGDMSARQANAIQQSMQARAAAPKSGPQQREVIRGAIQKDPKLANAPALLARKLGLSVGDVKRELNNILFGR